VEELASYKKQIQTRINSYNSLKKYIDELDKNMKDVEQNPFVYESNINSILSIMNKFPIGASEEKIIENNLSCIKDGLQNRKSETVEKFTIDFDKLMAKEGRSLAGRVPKIRSGFFSWDIDMDKGILHLWWGNEKELLTETNIDAKAAFDDFKKIETALFHREMDHGEYLKMLFRAYKMELARADLKMGDPAHIHRVYDMYVFLLDGERKAVSKRPMDLPYSKVQFSYDLYRLKEKRIGHYEFGMNAATLAATKAPGNFIWVPVNENGEGTVVSHIVFKEVVA
jgi:hypothetical protein